MKTKEDKTLLQVLARAWIECDPNRGGDQDELMLDMSNKLKNKPRWMWFLPRAKSLKKYLKKNGYEIVRKND